MTEIIKQNIELCAGCNRCVRECPMETANVTYQDETGSIKVKIDRDKCISCGRCFAACKHKARDFADDTERFFADLAAGVPISVIAAPSIKTNIPEYGRLFTYLKRLGVKSIYDVSLGADICIWAHIKYIGENGSAPMITQPCPVIVSYCEMYRHDLLRRLSPVQSPMACTSIYMKRYRGISDSIAALSPCMAKTNEFVDTRLAEYNVTFTKLLEYMEKNGIVPPDEESDFDHAETGLGSLFPMPGGLKENIEYFTGKELHIAKAEGFDVYAKLDEYARTPEEILPDIYDVLNCTEGCNLGTAYSHNRSMFEIDKTMDGTRKKAAEERKRAHYESEYKTYNESFELGHFLREYLPIPKTVPEIDDGDIGNAFKLLGKTDYEKQHIDCCACGSATCRDMARKIALNVNVPENCIVKSKEDAKAEHEENLRAHEHLAELEKSHEADARMRIMLDTMPFSTQIWNRDFTIIDCNQETVRLFKLSDKKDFSNNFAAYSPEFQPDGRKSEEKADELLNQVFEEGQLRFEWLHQMRNGELIPTEITLVRVEHNGNSFVAAYIRDLREHRKMMSAIEKRDHTLGIMNRVASVLLAEKNDEDFEETLAESMEIIGLGMDADCVQIWPNETRDGQLCFTLSHKWLSDAGKNAPDVEIGTAVPYSKRWLELFLRGECVNGPVGALPQEDQDLLSPLGLTSTITIPLYYQDEFWGVFCVDDVVKERYFMQDEIDMLHSVTLMIVNAINRDMTQKRLKTALERMEEAQSTTASMFDSNPHINILFDSSFNIIDCNPAALKFMGYETEEEFFANFARRMTEGIPKFQPDGHASVPLQERLLAAARDGSVKFETEMVMDGAKKTLNVDFRKIPYRNSFAVVGYIYDMTDSLRSQEQYKLQLAKLDMAVRASRIGLWEMEIVKNDPVNPDNIFIWSDEFRHMLGYTDETDFPNVLKSWSDILHPDDRDRVLETFAEYLLDTTGQVTYDVEYRLLKKDGEYSYYHASGSTVRDKIGSLVRVVGTLVDITETKNIILDSERQRIEAEAANKAKSNFLSTMSHEIRTPMNAIIGMTAIGKLSGEMQKKDDALEKIDGASKHLLGIINDVLDMSKIEADKFELSPVSFDFEKMLQKIADVINLRVDERRQKFFVNIGSDIPQTLIGDDQRLSQVITNLLSNAVKFTPEEGSIRLDAELLSLENPEPGSEHAMCRLKISVEDTGIGISGEQQTRLFKSFEQAEVSTTRKYGGTGLGLAITKRIVELMDGEIWVESEFGKGSKFIFTFLMKRGEAMNRHLLDESVNWENIRIFVVDDEPEIREFFTVVSENIGVSCTVAASGEEAAEMIERDDNYNIYFIDWKLPGMDGIEFAKRIQSKHAHNSIVTIFSSVDWNVIEDEAKSAGVDKFLPKPLFPSIIVDVINTCIHTKSGAKPDAVRAAAADFTGYTILLADDVEINREIVLALLEPTGLKVECAEDGSEAVAMFRKTPERYDMVFMDIQMPEMDGYEATRLIRGLGCPGAETVPIIAMTANVFREDIEKCIEAGMNGHIGKPIDLDEVIGELKKYLK